MRNGPLTESEENVSARPDTQHRETGRKAKGEKGDNISRQPQTRFHLARSVHIVSE